MSGFVISSLMAIPVANVLVGIWDSVWPYLLMLAGFSAIIFVHELGHFAVAKWAGVRVEKFAIGFGRELIGFTRGETRYSWNILPLGGYVKMLGQEDFDDKSNELKFNDDPRSFVNKPVEHRMAIVSAGVIMNILFACLLFMIVFLIGMESDAPRIAYVEPDSPADRAGVEPGDWVQKVNGERVLEYNEVMMSIMLAPPHEPIEFIVERNGETAPPIFVKPDYRIPENTRDAQRQVIGISSSRSREIVYVGPEINPNDPKAPKPGDLLVEFEGAPVTDQNINNISELLGYRSGPVTVERKDPEDPKGIAKRVEISIPPQLAILPSDPTDPESASVLGLTPLQRFGSLDPRGRAFLAGLDVGDTVLSWDDKKFPSGGQVSASIRDNPERDIAFTVRKSDGRTVSGSVRPKRHKRGAGTVQAAVKALPEVPTDGSVPHTVFVEVLRDGAAAKAGIETGDVVVQLDDVPNPSMVAVKRMLGERRGETVSIAVRKPDGRLRRTVLRPIAPGSIDASLNVVADDLMQIGRVVPSIHGKPSPAAVAGLTAGATILAVNNQAVTRWRGLIELFQKNAGREVRLSYRTPEGNQTTIDFSVPPCLRTVLGLGPEARILRVGEKEHLMAKTSRAIEEVSVRYHEGTRVALTELVGQTDVPIRFRRNLLSPEETAHVSVTESMTDPWLGRIAFSPNVILGPETQILKGNNALQAVWIGLHKTYYFVMQVYQVLNRMIFSRSVSAEAMSGPLGILDVGGKIAQSNGVKFLFFLAIISANLAVINFLPLPIVDGGLMVFLLIEKIKGSPVSLRVQVATQMIGIFLIIGAFLFVTYNDAVRLWG